MTQAKSWLHRGVRPLARPLLRLGVHPNHVTLLHLVLGLLSLAAIAQGSWRMRLLGGLGWLVSCLLDRLDGELARVGELSSAFGHRLDYLTDMWLSALYFAALGLSVRGVPGSAWWLAAGALASLCQFGNGQVAERYDRLSGAGGHVLASRWGFDADDALCLLGPLAWMPAAARAGAVTLAAAATFAYLMLFTARLRRLRLTIR